MGGNQEFYGKYDGIRAKQQQIQSIAQFIHVLRERETILGNKTEETGKQHNGQNAVDPQYCGQESGMVKFFHESGYEYIIQWQGITIR